MVDNNNMINNQIQAVKSLEGFITKPPIWEKTENPTNWKKQKVNDVIIFVFSIIYLADHLA